MSRKATVFINKYTTSETLGRSTHEERKLINEQNRARRAQRPSRPASDLGLGSPSFNVIPTRPRRQSRNVQASSFPFVEESPWVHSYTSNPQNDTNNTNSNIPVQTLVPHMPGNTIDPFHTNCIIVDAEVAGILQYYTDVLHDWMWTNAAASVDFELDLKALNVCRPQEIVARCMQNKTRLQTLVAHAASHMQHRDGIKLNTDSLQYVQEGTNAFLSEFEAKNRVVDKWMLLHVLHLCAAAFASQQLDAIRVHINGYKALIDGIDGACSNIDAKTIALLTQIDVEAPRRLIQYLSQNQRAIWLHQAGKSCASSYGCNQLTFEPSKSSPMLNRSELITPEILHTVQKCRQFADSFERAINQGEDSLTIMRRLSVQNRALYQQVLRHNMPDARSKCLLHALLTWIWNANHIGPMLAEAACVQVRNELESMPTGDWDNQYDILLWICLTVALASVEGSSTQKYFWCEVIRLSKSQGILNIVDTDNSIREKTLKTFAKGYLWLEALQGPKLHGLISNSWR